MMRTEKLKDGFVTHCHTDAVIKAAEDDLLLYFTEHGRQCMGAIEDRFCGEPSSLEILTDTLGRWYGSPYFPALGRLVDRGEVMWVRDGAGNVWYGLRKKLAEVTE